jgi:predicted alternative tryptophan synthase beta-subunit
VLNHVLLHQTVIGQEAIEQMAWPATIPTSSSAARAADRTLPAW